MYALLRPLLFAGLGLASGLAVHALLIALGFLFGGYEISDVANDIALNNSLTNLPPGGFLEYLGAILFTLG